MKYTISQLSRDFRDFLEQDNSVFNIRGDSNIGTIRVDSRFDGVANIRGDANIGHLEFYNSEQKLERETKTNTIELESSLPSHATLQPGSTAVYTALLSVKNSIIFTPSQYRLQFNVNYSFKSLISGKLRDVKQVQEDNAINQENVRKKQEEEELFTNTVPHEISIRPSVYSIMLGSVIGGGIGSLARALQINPSLDWTNFTSADFIVSIAVSVILSAVAIVFMARKSDTQSFLSIEDFWGGLLIGFLIGYTGASFFQELTGIDNPG